MCCKTYLVTSDCYNFTEVDRLTEISSECIIEKLKQHFARYGIPNVVSDSGTQFMTVIFREFAATWGYRQDTSSPGNHKSNGTAESSVKTIKKLMKQCRASNEDLYIALLN